MTIDFYAKKANGHPIRDTDGQLVTGYNLNLSNVNGRAFLGLLGMPCEDELLGELTLPEARRAIIYARATFKRRAPEHTRESSDTKRPGKCRFIETGIDEDYLESKLDLFEAFVAVAEAEGATSVYWG